jgi:hypothetical protein
MVCQTTSWFHQQSREASLFCRHRRAWKFTQGQHDVTHVGLDSLVRSSSMANALPRRQHLRAPDPLRPDQR